MLRFVNSDIVFQEIPDEVTLAINIAACPCRCPGCHSKHLWADKGTPLTPLQLDALIAQCSGNITCVSFMGGDSEPREVDALAAHIRAKHPRLKTAWYSGRSILSPLVSLYNFDYIKIGPYLQHLGGLKSSTTNQRLYKIENGVLHNVTHRFWKNTTSVQ
ncbi:MAG: anaerobic ribonucleoside-triphosphate reductase activating protein [Bacteroidales bacterium]|nr:anaerobic ribonucleoside-triphosphate reductase activating protein [Bacteroidales bacterium]